ncbi:hypothetical protein [Flavobacterium sp. C4GT6]|uniref:hypothetical protein n=1 Tax=Flavobacterium sp. C4GT6 TaxID=3103818 RepID=UPI002ED18D25
MEFSEPIYNILGIRVGEGQLNMLLQFANALGSVATFLTFLYLLYEDYKKGKRISDLERVAITLERDLELRYQPYLWLNGMSTRPNNCVDFDLNNKGAWCRLLEFKVLSGDLEMDEVNKHLPWELEQPFSQAILSDTTRRFIFTQNNSGKPVREIESEIEVVYEDRLGNKYRAIVKCHGLKCTISAPESL